MKKAMLVVALVLIALSINGLQAAPKGESEDGDKTLSPYFLVTTDNDSAVDQFSLKETRADVKIAGVIADVTVTQTYENKGAVPLECIYVFPASSRAAVYGLKMTIGERTIVAKIEERKKAREDYEQAKKEGKSASLLEQQRPNVFQMNVANIMPGDQILVELKYTELLIPTAGVYEFAYPTVVGPRYSNQAEETAPENDKWVKNPYLPEGKDAPYGFDITINLAAGMPLQDVTSDTHKIDVAYQGKNQAGVTLKPGQDNGGNRDYILHYRLAGGKIETGLLLYEGEKENFFLLMAQPPAKVKEDMIPPRDYVFIVDVSGSMRGFPLDISKELLRNLIGALRPTDTFNVLLFAGGANALSEKPLPANAQNIDKAIKLIDGQEGGGGTELLPALKRALELTSAEGVSRTFVIATDGYVMVEKEAFDLIRDNLDKANMFAFGIGTSVNRFIIEGMAHVGGGEPFVITEPAKAEATAEQFRKLIQTPALTDVKIDFDGLKVYDVEPLKVPDVLAERPVVVFGKYRGAASGAITISGVSGEGDYKQTLEVEKSRPDANNSALRYLWARKRVQLLDDYNKLGEDDQRVKEVTKLGLDYNLLTAYTSFIAIDSLARNKTGDLATVKQPLPLPEGVPNTALPSAPMAKMMRSRDAMSMPEPAKLPEEKEADGGGAKKDEEKPKQAASLKITLTEVKAAGALSESDAVASINAHFPDLQKLIKQELKATPGLSGKIVIELELDGAGKIAKVKVVSAPEDLKEISKKIVKKINDWKFAASPDGKPTTITLTISIE